MGRRGPTPKPAADQKLRGNPGKRKLPKAAAPPPAAGLPECPDWLDTEAQAEWGRVVPELAAQGLLGRLDRGTLAAYCSAWSEFRKATELLEEEGPTFTTDKGYIAQHPAVAMQRTAWAALHKFAALFGLDPGSRARLGVGVKPDKPKVAARKRG